MWDWLKKGLGVPDNARNLGEIVAHVVRGKPGQFYHRFMETPIGEQEAATFTEADYDPGHLEIMRQMARLAMEEGRYSTYNQSVAEQRGTKDYATLGQRLKDQGTLNKDTARDIRDLGHTLGSYRFDIRDGQVYAVDDYNLNQHYMGPEIEAQLGLPPASEEGTPYTQEDLQNVLEERGWSSERSFPWWSSFKTLLSGPTTQRNNAALLGMLHSPPFKETSIPVDVSLGSVSDVYGPMHYGNRPIGGTIGR